MKKIISKFSIIAGLVFFAACSELPVGQTPTDGIPPSPVTNVKIVAAPGGAKITYDLPTDQDISYVKAEYVYKGVKHTVRQSIYDNTLSIEGLGSIEAIEVTLWVVDHSENVSVPVSETFTPDTPIIETIFASMEIIPTFGGIIVMMDNTTETEVGVTVYVEDSLGIMREYATKFAKDRQISLAVRGLINKPYKLAASLIDKWDNTSDKKEATITPYYETELDRNKFLEVGLPGDNTTTERNRPLKNCWDGSLDVIWHAGYTMFPPHHITIDLGVEVTFSRMKLWPRKTYDYSNYTFKKFEVWGATTYPEGKDEAYWTGEEWKADWVLVGDYEVKRPSGNTEPSRDPGGEDHAYAEAGFDFTAPTPAPRLRFLRFIVKETWSPGTAMHMAEFKFWGDDGSGGHSEN